MLDLNEFLSGDCPGDGDEVGREAGADHWTGSRSGACDTGLRKKWRWKKGEW